MARLLHRLQGTDAGVKGSAKNKAKIHPKKAELENRAESPDTARQMCCVRDYFFPSSNRLCGMRRVSFPKLFTQSPPTRKGTPEVLILLQPAAARAVTWSPTLPNRTLTHPKRMKTLRCGDPVPDAGVRKDNYGREGTAGFVAPLDLGSWSKGGVEDDS